MQNKTSTSNFLSGPILGPLMLFALPLMLSLFLQALYGGVDLAVVGMFSPTASVSAVATGSQMMQSITAIITGLTMGVTVLVGKAIGAGSPEEAGRTVKSQIRLFLIVAIALTLAVFLLAPQIARMLQVPTEAFDETVGYLRICALGIVFITAYNGISGIFRGIGNSRSPFIFALIACTINIVLDLLFVGLFHMNASGAALATILAQASSVLFSLFYMKRHPLPFSIHVGKATGMNMGEILKIGSPIALQDFLTNLSFLLITAIVNTLGVVASAGVGISEKLFVFLALVPMSFMSALSTFTAQNMGAGNRRRADEALKLSSIISFLVGLVMFLLTFLLGESLASIFSKDPLVIHAAGRYLHGSAYEYIITSVVFCMLGYFNGREKTTFVMAQGLAAAFLVRVPLSYIFSIVEDASVYLISFAVPISAMVNLILCLIYLIRLKKKDRKEL